MGDGVSKRHINYIGTIIDGIINRLDQVIVGIGFFLIKNIKRHELSIPSNSTYANLIITFCANNPCNMRAMLIFIGFRCFLDKVPTVNIVDISILIIINSISWNLSLVDPDIVVKIWVIDVNTTIDYCNNNIRSIGAIFPRLNRLDICPLEASRLSYI